MGYGDSSSAIKCEQVVKNIEEILAIELILATSQWRKKQFDYHSDLFKEYLSFMADEEVTTLKKQRLSSWVLSCPLAKQQ